MKPHGTGLWAIVTGMDYRWTCGRPTRAPEIKALEQADSYMDMVSFCPNPRKNKLHVIFRRPQEEAMEVPKQNGADVTFDNPRQGAPKKLSPNHFRFATSKRTLYQQMVGLLKVVEYELVNSSVVIHYGWPLSSWLDRMSIGVMVFNIMRLPKVSPVLTFTSIILILHLTKAHRRKCKKFFSSKVILIRRFLQEHHYLRNQRTKLVVNNVAEFLRIVSLILYLDRSNISRQKRAFSL